MCGCSIYTLTMYWNFMKWSALLPSLAIFGNMLLNTGVCCNLVYRYAVAVGMSRDKKILHDTPTKMFECNINFLIW